MSEELLKEEYASEEACKLAIAKFNEGKKPEEEMRYCSYFNSIKQKRMYQHYEPKYYETNECSENTRLAIVMLASHFYESRDGSTGGFFGDSVHAGEQAMKTANTLLRLDRNWKV